jgi:hypothetical protein
VEIVESMLTKTKAEAQANPPPPPPRPGPALARGPLRLAPAGRAWVMRVHAGEPLVFTVLEASNVHGGVTHQLKIREDWGPGVFSYGQRTVGRLWLCQNI